MRTPGRGRRPDRGRGRILASIRDETLRWRKIKEPPEDPRTGQHRWTVDTANREVGRSVDSPFTVSEWSAQRWRCLQWVKDKAALEHLTPLTWTPKEGYRFSADPAEWISYERHRFHTELTRITRLITATVGPHAGARPNDKFARTILAQLEGVRATYESLVTDQS
ncbi:DUF6192 family protein [Nonomuraea sp. B19D2]|uniref:DUF6192 family protein n=1 Tax=Nonomuraea sp. B19D2 TaxID=3159561 RepID=UPI0032D9CDFF